MIVIISKFSWNLSRLANDRLTGRMLIDYHRRGAYLSTDMAGRYGGWQVFLASDLSSHSRETQLAGHVLGMGRGGRVRG